MSAPNRPVMPPEEIPLGAHLATPRRGYTHHGIYIGDGRVVHYAGLSRSLTRGPVEVVTLERFAGGRGVRIVPDAPTRFVPQEIVRRALSRLGEDLYRLASNNCEHFCTWCRSGEGRSEQVERWLGPLRAALRLAGSPLSPFGGTGSGWCGAASGETVRLADPSCWA